MMRTIRKVGARNAPYRHLNVTANMHRCHPFCRQGALAIRVSRRDPSLQGYGTQNCSGLFVQRDYPEKGSKIMRKTIMTLMVAAGFLLPAVPASAAQEYFFTRGQIKDIQRTLTADGHYRAGIDGIWGPQSRSGLRGFQAERGLPVTGRLDMATLDELGYRVSSVDRRVIYSTADDQTAYRLQEIAPASGNARVIYREEIFKVAPPQYLSKTETQALQQALRDSGYLKTGEVDGLWDMRTVNALSSYQMNEGLAATGVPDDKTLTHLGVLMHASDQIPQMNE
ncbi:MAG: peptidoglycan-binding protein [Micavibrio aeruginosavorus]|nr:peptidoglycan-binding protein [Micavibrio aeruginosavorus]